jgi:hypothetical protein
MAETMSKFQQRLAERRAQQEAELQSIKEAHPSFDSDLVPEQPHERSDEDKEMDRIISGIDIIDAYRKWCGKMNPNVKGGQTESIMISCPVPGHADKNPSAWINTDKQTWFCGACNQGGDALDLAAFHFGISNYKDGANFHELRKKMAQDYGYTIKRTLGGNTVITPPESEPEEEEPVKVVQLVEDIEEVSFQIGLDWRNIVPKNTFLRAYMEATAPDDIPEEYNFWNGLLAIGFAIGRDVRLMDRVPVFGNLFVCTLGRSGSGKSRAESHFENLMFKALPYTDDDNSKGMKTISTAASGEALVRGFMKAQYDPMNPKKILGYLPVRGLIEYNELSALVSRTQRIGNSAIPTLQSLYDMKPQISTDAITSGAKVAQEPFASALTTTQPKALKGLLTGANQDSGFINRWVFAPGVEKKRVAIGGAMIDITPAVKPLQEIHGWSASFKPTDMMGWSAEAADRFTNFYHDTIAPDQKSDDNDMLTRVDLLLKKLILLFTANRLKKEVPIESVEEAIACYPYIVQSYGITSSQVGLSEAADIANVIIEFVRRHEKRTGKPASLSDMKKGLKNNAAFKKVDPRMLASLIKDLIAIEELLEVPPKPGDVGRPTTRYRYVG